MARSQPTPPVSATEKLYHTRVVLWRQPIVMRQLGLALGGGLVALGLVLILVGGPLDWAWLGQVARILGLVALIMLGLCVVGVLVFYGRGYEYAYRLDDEGIEARPIGRTAHTNRIVNTLLMLSGRPGPAGAGMLAASRQVERVDWRQIDEARLQPKGHTISLYRRGKRQMAVFASPDNKDALLADIEAHLTKQKAGRERPA